MKNSLKTAISMVLTLSSLSLFAGIRNWQGNEHDFNKLANDTIVADGTPVYEGDLNHQVAILEKDYPKVAARFLSIFPEASNQLWIREGKSLFVYFTDNGSKVTAVFSLKGCIHYSISIIGFERVPESLLRQIKKDYPLFSFFSAKKIQTGGYTAYELVFENSDEFITIRTTDDDEVVIVNKLLKTTSNENTRRMIP